MENGKKRTKNYVALFSLSMHTVKVWNIFFFIFQLLAVFTLRIKTLLQFNFEYFKSFAAAYTR